jgi:enterochelin esterase-like enzyme
MSTMRMQTLVGASAVLHLLVMAPVVSGQRGDGPPQVPARVVVSPELQGRQVTFRIRAPEAKAVRLNGGGMVGTGSNAMTKDADGVWEITVGPLDPGAYRYTFNVDGLAVVDPRNPLVSQSRDNVVSLLHIPGADFMDAKDVPHGAVAQVHYYSTSVKAFRRMHVYTPPGYETSTAKYPVFYLLHGAGDSDNSWTTVGRASYILDNLIAAKKAKPMVVVMPAGHMTQTMPGMGRGGGGGGTAGAADEFARDFVTDLMPYVEKHYRISTDRANRAIAGLSMGGGQTMNIAFLHLDKFSAIGVFSSSVAGGGGRGGSPEWEKVHEQGLATPAFKRGLKLIWLSTGVDDGVLAGTKATVEMLKRHGFNQVVFKESPGGHTWVNWRNYLQEFAAQLF